MEKTIVVYWSQTGNTEKMAEAVAEGAKSVCSDVKLVEASQITADDLKAYDVFALGCPAMGDEVLEEEVMEPLVAEVEGFASGKKIAIFGSYGWGDGQWMRDWEERMKAAGAQLVGGEGLMLNEEPDDDGLEQCRELGKKMA